MSNATMSKCEASLTRRYWTEAGGTLIEEFPAGRRGADRRHRLLDGVVILGGSRVIAKPADIQIAGRDIVVIETKASRLGM